MYKLEEQHGLCQIGIRTQKERDEICEKKVLKFIARRTMERLKEAAESREGIDCFQMAHSAIIFSKSVYHRFLFF